MNFSGFVPIRRGLIDHTRDGRLSMNEHGALVTLILLADKATGGYTINAPTLRSYLPGLSEDAAKKVLKSLEDKRYIYRDITPRSPLVYPYWIHRYEPTAGAYKALQLDLSQVFETKDTSKLRYVEHAPDIPLEGALDPTLDPPPEGAHYNNKDKDKKTEKEKLSSLGKNGGMLSSTSERFLLSPTRAHESEAMPIDSRNGQLVPSTAHDGQMLPDGSLALAETPPIVVPVVTEADQLAYRNRQLAPMRLGWRDGSYYDLDTDMNVQREEWLRRMDEVSKKRRGKRA